ncbi:MAG: adenylyltransferase/cytidyltransferase family protein [Gemmatimonadota bacterium]|nr:adenylyltransferase/cytidyltransferase family protein [Gemmatimonadota bacterium]MDP6528923.1 adenylyltransferase/cytidyltransferase family protein [Gemmatimonadota bacterium]MDP6803224.1 adenylyltransferase/cytidyltransferase family protein [Gemmatimonadota bacterium]MDP7032689.1 adenylyltransferase/cytidyltransferase family protein [Gemmatimonadota bacterium]
MRDCNERVLKLDELAAEVRQLRADASGLRVVLANGIFDLLHVGHVRYLLGARSVGDFLIVAVNDDASAARHKGPGRPFVCARERAEMVASLRGVDRVVLFGEDTVEAVLRAIRPDIHAKGTDYTEESVPEREMTASLGGRTVIVGDPKDHSSTNLLEVILERTGRTE